MAVVSETASDGTLSAVSKQFRVSKSIVSKLWKIVKGTGSISPKKPPERVPLHHHDLIELQKREKPSISYATIREGEVENSEFSENSETSENQFSEVFNSEFSILHCTQNGKLGVENRTFALK